MKQTKKWSVIQIWPHYLHDQMVWYLSCFAGKRLQFNSAWRSKEIDIRLQFHLILSKKVKKYFISCSFGHKNVVKSVLFWHEKLPILTQKVLRGLPLYHHWSQFLYYNLKTIICKLLSKDWSIWTTAWKLKLRLNCSHVAWTTTSLIVF